MMLPVEKKKIVLFIASLKAGGAERVFVNLSNALASEGFAPIILVGTLDQAAYTETISPEVRVCELGVRHMRSAVLPLVRFLRRERPGVLISALEHSNLAAILAAKLARTGTPVMATIHQTFSRALEMSRSLHQKALIRAAIKVTPMADRIVTVSHGTAADFARLAKIPKEHINVIYNPIVGPALYQSAQEPIDHPWFQEGQPPVVLGMGRLTAQKDFPNLIRAFASLKKTSDARLMIFGDGEERDPLERLVREMELCDCVSMPGVVSNPYAYLKRASLFVLSSAWEALPTVLVEAMACGCPVVSTDCKNGPREILRDGQYGELVPVGDSQRLADAMQRALQTPKSPLPPEALQPFEASHVIQQYIELIQEMTSV
jgi:glycosyltransferase involved in cell wall biosynthesis